MFKTNKLFKLKEFYVKTPNPFYNTSQLIINIRGHVRESLRTPQLYLFLKKLSRYFELKIYIHTWNIKANNLSWQKIKQDTTVVTKQIIKDYFHDLPVVSIIVEDDKQIELIGNTSGTMFSTQMSKLGWKNMWCGMYTSMKQLYENENDNVLILNTRFDIFINSCKVKENELFTWLITTIQQIKYRKLNHNYFMYDSFKYGIDNQIIGDKYTLYKLIHHFHHELDHINQLYYSIKSQEKAVYYENLRIF
jgi:hypothetical protein